jgi:cobalamin biosynthesis Mg chelatase CobN
MDAAAKSHNTEYAGFRFYDRALTADEVAANYAADTYVEQVPEESSVEVSEETSVEVSEETSSAETSVEQSVETSSQEVSETSSQEVSEIPSQEISENSVQESSEAEPPYTGDSGLIAIAILSVIALAGVVVIKRR